MAEPCGKRLRASMDVTRRIAYCRGVLRQRKIRGSRKVTRGVRTVVIMGKKTRAPQLVPFVIENPVIVVLEAPAFPVRHHMQICLSRECDQAKRYRESIEKPRC